MADTDERAHYRMTSSWISSENSGGGEIYLVFHNTKLYKLKYLAPVLCWMKTSSDVYKLLDISKRTSFLLSYFMVDKYWC